MSTERIFQLQLLLGYVPWFFAFFTYAWPKLKRMDRVEAQRTLALIHSFRFFGLAFLIPGVVGPGLSQPFAFFAAYGDFATGALAMATLASVRVRWLFTTLVILYNVVGVADLLGNYVHGVQYGLPAMSGQLGGLYWIPILFVPLLMIMHGASLSLVWRKSRPSHATS